MLEELAERAGMSRFALVRAFAREVGIPPHTYQIHLRVQRARELIAGGSSLSEVSLEVGFTDQSHLNRHFKRLIGITPGLYARSLAGDWAPPRLDARIPFLAAITDPGYATNDVHETARRAV
jgi:AraC-like DNA-binding protein